MHIYHRTLRHSDLYAVKSYPRSLGATRISGPHFRTGEPVKQLRGMNQKRLDGIPGKAFS